jgi:cyanophycin synthetase
VRGFLDGLRYPSLEIAVTVRARPTDNVWLRRVDAHLRDALPGAEAIIARDSPTAKGGPAVAALLFWVREIQQAAKLPVLDLGKITGIGPTRTDMRIPTFVHAFAPTYAVVEWLLDLFALAEARKDLQAHMGHLPGRIEELNRRLIASANIPRLLRTAHGLGMPFVELPGGVFQIGHGSRSRWLESTFTDETPQIGARFARNKAFGASVLRQAGLPTPDHFVVRNLETAVKAAESIGYPVVVKPADTDGGTAVATGLSTPEEVCAAFERATRHSADILVEKHFEGRDYRMTVVGSELIWAAERIPGGITGDGRSTVAELVEEQAADRARRDSVLGRKHALVIDDEARELLGRAGLDTGSIPLPGHFVRLRRAANIGLGGRAVGVFDRVHPDNRALAVRAARALRLDVAGIDLLIPDISRSWLEVGAAICEVNAQPDLGVFFPHIYGEVLSRLVFGNGRIPIVVVVGAPGDGVLVTDIARHLAAAGWVVGQAGPAGVLIGAEALGGVSGWRDGARAFMSNQAVDAAVIAVDADVLQSGLPFDSFDVLVMAGTHIAPKRAPTTRLDPAEQMLRSLLPMCSGAVVTLAGAAMPAAFPLADSPAHVIAEPMPGNELARRVAEFVGERHKAFPPIFAAV